MTVCMCVTGCVFTLRDLVSLLHQTSQKDCSMSFQISASMFCVRCEIYSSTTPYTWSPRLRGIIQLSRRGNVLRNIMINPRISAVWITTKAIAPFSFTPCVQEVHTKAEFVLLIPLEGMDCCVQVTPSTQPLGSGTNQMEIQ